MYRIFIVIFALLTSNASFGHGEDKLGPNGGYVRMPGAFHTELVPLNKNSLKVYLLDIQWKNPSVTNSKLIITYNKKSKAKCEVKENYYLCVLPNNADLTKNGELNVMAERDEQKGMDVYYRLPLKLEIADDGLNSRH